MEVTRHSWVEPGAHDVAPGVHRIPCPLPGDGLQAINVYAIADGDGVAIIDAGSGWPAAAGGLEAGLAELGHGLADVTAVICTHAHYDHYGDATRIRRESGATVMLGRIEAEMVRVAYEPGGYERWTEERFRWLSSHDAEDVIAEVSRATGGVRDAIETGGGWGPPDRLLENGDTVQLAGRDLLVIHSPGHTRGQLMFLDRAANLLFAGDHVLPHITPSLGFEPYTDGRALEYYLASLARARVIGEVVVAPGHGPLFDDLAGRVDELIAHHDQRLGACLTVLADVGRTSARTVAAGLPWTRRATHFDDLDAVNRMLAVTETATHLELLVLRGAVARHDDERVQYSLTATGRD